MPGRSAVAGEGRRGVWVRWRHGRVHQLLTNTWTRCCGRGEGEGVWVRCRHGRVHQLLTNTWTQCCGRGEGERVRVRVRCRYGRVHQLLTNAWTQCCGRGKGERVRVRCRHGGVHQVGVGAVVCPILIVWRDPVRELWGEARPGQEKTNWHEHKGGNCIYYNYQKAHPAEMVWPLAKDGRGGYHQEDVKLATAGKEKGEGPTRDGWDDMKEYKMTVDMAHVKIKAGPLLHGGGQ